MIENNPSFIPNKNKEKLLNKLSFETQKHFLSGKRQLTI
jgi:hypothetical protein